MLTTTLLALCALTLAPAANETPQPTLSEQNSTVLFDGV